MVATRRGVRVSPSRKTDSDQGSAAQATPSTGSRTRSAAKPPNKPTQSDVEEASTQLHKLSKDNAPPTSAKKRCTRASRLHSPDNPCTPVSSVHEGDISDLESCCSAVSDVERPVTRRSTRRPPWTVNKDDVSEVESCSSVASASKVRRSTRRKAVPRALDSASETKDNEVEPQSNKRTTRAASRAQIEDSEVSDAESAAGDAPKPTPRRSTRGRRKAEEESSQSPAPTPRTTRAMRSKASSSDVPMSCDSEGFESGPRYSWRARQLKVAGSDSDVGKGTPTSSRTSPGRNKVEQVSPMSPRNLSIVLEKAIIPPEQEESTDDSRLESRKSTLIEDNEEKEEPNTTETKQGEETPLEKSTAEEGSINSHNESADELVVITADHQEELDAEKASEIETTQEAAQAPETSEPLQSASENTATRDSQITDSRDEDMEVAIADTDIMDRQKEEDGDAEMMERDQTEARSVSGKAQQVAESTQESKIGEDREEPIQATSSQRQTTEEQSSEQSKTVMNLLDSSEDEDDEEDDFADEIRASSGDDEVLDLKMNKEAVQSRKTEVTESIEGLFMIDTRPGQEADEQYYQDGPREDRAAQEEAADEEDDEEFVDEEGDDDDDNAADILFSSRNPQAKELSSRIDPGIRMKELGGLYISFDGSKSNPVSSSQQKTKEKKIQDEVMKKSVIGPDFEKKEAVPPYKESKRALKLKHRAEREKTTGDAWFNMKAPEITPELKGDLQLLRMRGSMDSKRFYKKSDRDGFPKYFQMGTVVDNPVDFYHSRVSKKDRKRTMVEELLADAEFRQTNKKKFHAIMAEKAAQAAGKRHRKKNKFHNKK